MSYCIPALCTRQDSGVHSSNADPSDSHPVSESPIPSTPTDPHTDVPPSPALESSSSHTHIGDIDGLSVEEVARRLVADALSRAINNYSLMADANSVSVQH